jgi:hypothetical protein
MKPVVEGNSQRGFERECKFDGDCFVAGTLVHTDKGLVPIEQLKVGDMVLSKHESGEGEQAYKRVVKTFKSVENKRVMTIMYSNIDPETSIKLKSQNFSVVYLTENHLVWVSQIGEEAAETLADEQGVDFVDPNIQLGWTPAQGLRNGMLIELENGSKGEVIDVYNQLFANKIDGLYWEGLDASLDCNPERLLDFRSDSRKIYHISGYVEMDCSADNAIHGTISSDNPDEFVAVQEFIATYGVDRKPHLYNSEIAELYVYNIEVEDFHTYYVDYFGLWVHEAEASVGWV